VRHALYFFLHLPDALPRRAHLVFGCQFCPREHLELAHCLPAAPIGSFHILLDLVDVCLKLLHPFLARLRLNLKNAEIRRELANLCRRFCLLPQSRRNHAVDVAALFMTFIESLRIL
jgi:hypothetical protein